MNYFAALDVSLGSVQLCVIDEKGEIQAEDKLESAVADAVFVGVDAGSEFEVFVVVGRITELVYSIDIVKVAVSLAPVSAKPHEKPVQFFDILKQTRTDRIASLESAWSRSQDVSAETSKSPLDAECRRSSARILIGRY